VVGSPSFGVVIPGTGFSVRGPAFADAVDAIEGLGFDTVWFGDHVALPSYAAHIIEPNWLEPITACMLALGRTTRVRAGTDVLVLPYRNPVLVAKMAATADALSEGRLVLGIGVGYLKGEFAALGAEYERRGAVTDEYLRAMRVLWAGGGKPTSFEGEFLRFADVCVGPTPTQGWVPVWVGGNAPVALRRAATLGDGWHPLFPTPDAYRRGRDAITAIRDPSSPFSFSISLAPTKLLLGRDIPMPTPRANRGDLPEDFGYAPAVPLTDDGRIRFVGHPDQVAADVEEYMTAGVEHFTFRFSAMGGDITVNDWLDQLKRFAQEVMARYA
jgi:probable F420-dependent oxidoreductase